MKKIIGLSLLLISSGLFAQEPGRKGWFVGAGAGVSAIAFKAPWTNRNTQIGGSFPNLQVGRMLTRRSAVLLCLPGTIYSYTGSGRERDRGFEGIVPVFQYWLKERWWVGAGVGLGIDAPVFYDVKGAAEGTYFFGFSTLLSSGYEVLSRPRFALDVSGRYAYGSIPISAKEPGSLSGTMNGNALTLLLSVRYYLTKQSASE